MRSHILALALCMTAGIAAAGESTLKLQPAWEYVADTVMGGVSTGQIAPARIDGKDAVRLTGQVSLDNNGGFVQMAFDMQRGGGAMDASGYAGIEITLIGNNEPYDLRLRTDALRRPWQSFRALVVAQDTWTTLRIPWSAFEAHRTDATFDPARLRRIGVLAIGRVFEADVAVASVALYR